MAVGGHQRGELRGGEDPAKEMEKEPGRKITGTVGRELSGSFALKGGREMK